MENTFTVSKTRHHFVSEEFFTALGDTYPTGKYDGTDTTKWFSVRLSDTPTLVVETVWFLDTTSN